MADKARNQTTIPGERRVTVPATPLREAKFEPGDTLRVEAEGVGRIVLTRVDELIDRYSGSIETGGDLRDRVKGLREEWR